MESYKSIEEKEAIRWLRVMNDIRTIPGTIYSEQLRELTEYYDCPAETAKELRRKTDEELMRC